MDASRTPLIYGLSLAWEKEDVPINQNDGWRLTTTSTAQTRESQTSARMAILNDYDPLAALTHPSAEAQRVSDAIDDAIKAEKKKRDKREKSLVKVLLLGQSESGKSTTLKSA